MIRQKYQELLSLEKKDKPNDMKCSNCGMLKKNMSYDFVESKIRCDCGFVYKTMINDSEILNRNNIHYSNYHNPYFKNTYVGTVMKTNKNTLSMKNIMNIHKQNSIPIYFERRLFCKISKFKELCKTHNVENYIMEKGVEYLIMINKLKYKEGENKGRHLIFRKNLILIYAGCLSRAFKNCGKCRTNDYIGNIFNITKNMVNKGIKIINKIIMRYDLDIENKNIHPNDYVENYCNEQNICDFLKDLLKIIINNILKLNILNNKKYLSLIDGCFLFIIYKLKINIVLKFNNKSSVNETFFHLLNYQNKISPSPATVKKLINKYRNMTIFKTKPVEFFY